MLKTLLSALVLFCLAAFCSCQKEIASINETPLDTTQLPASESYIPLTDSTWWVYKDSATGEYDTATVLSETWLHDNVNYKKVHIVSASDSSYSYYGIKDNNIYIRRVRRVTDYDAGIERSHGSWRRLGIRYGHDQRCTSTRHRHYTGKRYQLFCTRKNISKCDTLAVYNCFQCCRNLCAICYQRFLFC